jgi:hypothetical protein
MLPKYYTFSGETLSISGWAKKLGLTKQAIHQRLKKHSIEVALKRTTRGRHTYNGETLTVKEWASRLGISPCALYAMLKDYSIGNIISGNMKKRKRHRRPRRSGMTLTYNGKSLTVKELANKLGVRDQELYRKLKDHSLDDIISGIKKRNLRRRYNKAREAHGIY